jgi:hypothetical protein
VANRPSWQKYHTGGINAKLCQQKLVGERCPPQNLSRTSIRSEYGISNEIKLPADNGESHGNYIQKEIFNLKILLISHHKKARLPIL